MVFYLVGILVIIRMGGSLMYLEKCFSKILVNNLLLILFVVKIVLWCFIFLSFYYEKNVKRIVGKRTLFFIL